MIATAPAALPDARDERAFGGKAAQLAAAAAAGLPVPPGVALGVPLVEAIAAGEREAVDRLCASLAAVAPPYAVRSSAVGEDSQRASFAGQHETRLGVLPGELADAVRRVHGSGRSDSALRYRRRLGEEEEVRMGVVVQRLVAAEAAGVMFTRNPLNGSDERVIEASCGLGEAVVAGRVIPDRFRMDRSGEVLERTPGMKKIAIRTRETGGTVEEEVDPELVERLCLDDRRLHELNRLAGRCEEVYGSARDIEWAFAEGRLYLLQCRAVTGSGS